MSLRAPPRRMLRAFAPLHAEFVGKVEFLLSLFPAARVTSWYRDPTDNRRVGGAARSQHLLAFGVDVKVASAEDRSEMVRLSRWLGFVAVDEGDHVHIQAWRAGTIPEAAFDLF